MPSDLTVEQQFRELGLLYNYEHDDSRQFTRWQMATAIAHGWRIASQSSPPAQSELLAKVVEASRFLLWQYDRKGPLADSVEAWEALREALNLCRGGEDG